MFDFDGNARAIEAMSDTERNSMLLNTIDHINRIKKSLGSIFTAPYQLSRADIDKDLFLLFKSFFGKNISDGAIISLLSEFNMFEELDNAVYHAIGKLKVTTSKDKNGKEVKKLYSGDVVLATSSENENSIFIFNKENNTNSKIYVSEDNSVRKVNGKEETVLKFDEDNLLKSRVTKNVISGNNLFGVNTPECISSSTIIRSDVDPLYVDVYYNMSVDDRTINEKAFSGYIDPLACFSLTNFRSFKDGYDAEEVNLLINRYDSSVAMFAGKIFPGSKEALINRMNKAKGNKPYIKVSE